VAETCENEISVNGGSKIVIPFSEKTMNYVASKILIFTNNYNLCFRSLLFLISTSHLLLPICESKKIKLNTKNIIFTTLANGGAPAG